MTTTHVDLVVIGGGPGGYVAAIRASQLGLKAVLIEREELGGVCLNWGCIPTKALLRVSELYHTMQHAEDFGITVKDVSIDIKKVVERSREVATTLSEGITHLMKKHNVEVIKGNASLLGKGLVSIIKSDKKKQSLKADHIILATGAKGRDLPGLEQDGKQILGYREAMVPKTIPEKLLIVGSGAIGIEFASFYNALGSKVEVIEVLDRILPQEDEEISAIAQKQFESLGIDCQTATTVTAIDKEKKKLIVTKEHKGKKSKSSVDKVIMAVGIVANTESLGLEHTKIQLEKGHIVVGDYQETHEPGVYAIGDVAGAPWLAHKASHEAVVCVEKIAGLSDVHPVDSNRIPGCTYSMPQIASIGLTEKQALDQGYELKVGRFPFLANGKAIAMGETEGMVKTLFDANSGALLGAHMIGAEVTEMIQGFVIAMGMETTEAELMHTIFPHPTLSEMMHESVLDAFGRALHI